MSGHSKWSTIKHQKGVNDRARGQIFTKLGNAITIAVREGGGSPNPQDNIRLRLAIEKARAANMPKDNIERAIAKAVGKHDGQQLEAILYEGFAPAGVAVLAEGVTDNKQRTAAAVKNIFHTHGGNLGSTGSVGYLFEKVGLLKLAKNKPTDEILETILASGALDFHAEESYVLAITAPQDIHRIKEYLVQHGVVIEESELTYKPTNVVEITDEQLVQKITDLVEKLDELEDIQRVHINAYLIPSKS